MLAEPFLDRDRAGALDARRRLGGTAGGYPPRAEAGSRSASARASAGRPSFSGDTAAEVTGLLGSGLPHGRELPTNGLVTHATAVLRGCWLA